MGRKLKSSDFVHLHNHTQYSLLDGLTKLPDLIKFVVEQKMTAVAITDHGTMSGAIEFYKIAKDNNVKPIIGIETYVAARKHTDKDPLKDKSRFHLILLAMNNTGYQNLMKLSTIANLEGYYYYPRIDRDLLAKYNQGIIALSGCMGSELGSALSQNQFDKAIEIAKWYKGIFGDRYYLEIQDHGHPDNPLTNSEQSKINDEIFKIAKLLDISVVVTSDAHYLKHSDQQAHEILLCVGTGSYLADEKRMTLKDYPLHLTPPSEIIKRWGTKHPEVIENTKNIAKRCSVDIELGQILIPKYPVPKQESEKSYLEKLVYRGLAYRYGGYSKKDIQNLTVSQSKKNLSKEVLIRAEYELKIVADMGFNGYFLIIADFINWGKNQGIVFGPGRGSAAGSIIAYALRITELDPLKYDLLFERFLNPDRISMPDIDIDIQDNRRDEVIQYCVDKYGDKRVANIVTFGRMAARNAVRDTARVLQVPYQDADRLAKMIPPPIQGRHIPLEQSLKNNIDLKNEYQNNPTAKEVFDFAVQLEGTIRSHGVHAAGVVIAPDDIVLFAPLEKAQKGVVATQYSMGPIEELGLLKMDFLGLSNLTTIKNTLRIIKKVHKKNIAIDSISLDDEKTYDLLKKADSIGVFQLESAGMKRYLKELQPSVFDDIIAMVALYRPGPMQFIDDFIKRKRGEKKITYPHPSMENALKSTYGVLVYQEQVMQISKEVCGFSGGEADTLRKAIGKKNAELMAKLKDKMIKGGQEYSNINKSLMERFWKQLEDFAAYCFNKSHAACYALIAYQTAYLKAHYPQAFMAALMTSSYGDTDRLAIEINECNHMGIEVLPPDVNESFAEFAVVPGKNQIRFGLSAVKNVGSSAVDEIIEQREKNGHFKNLDDFLNVVSLRAVNRKTIESLIKSGGFDSFGDRIQLLENLDLIMAYAAKSQKDSSSGQIDLFSGVDDQHKKPTLKLAKIESEYSKKQQLLWERELLGLYLSEHPLESFKVFLEEKTIPLSSIKPAHHNKKVIIGGLITDLREIYTKNNQKMAFVQLTDTINDIEVIVFPNSYAQTLGVWQKDAVLVIQGKVLAESKDGQINDQVKIIADDAREVTDEQVSAYQPSGKKKAALKPVIDKKIANLSTTNTLEQRLYIRIINTDDNRGLLDIKKHLENHKGDTEVVLVLGSDANRQAIKLTGGIKVSEELIDSIQKITGKQNIILK